MDPLNQNVRRTETTIVSRNGGGANLMRNIAIAATVLGAIALAYALYLIIVQPVPGGLSNIDEQNEKAAVRARGFTFLWLALALIAIPWLVWWILF